MRRLAGELVLGFLVGAAIGCVMLAVILTSMAIAVPAPYR